MKNKSIINILLLVILSFALFSCKQSFTVTYQDYDGKIILVDKVSKGDYSKAPSDPVRDGYTFVKWDKDTTKITENLIVTAVYEEIITDVDFRYTDSLKMDFDFSGKEFIKDGVGEVRLNKVVDGDTLSVYSGSSAAITIRFLGANTPESTGNVDPWGKAASAYAKGILYDAHSIVLEAEGERKDSGGKRWLAWIWYKATADSEYRLFNLQIVEMAYSKYSQKSDSKYHEIFKAAAEKTSKTKLRVWGEIDPNYNYSKEVLETTLLDLWYNHDIFQTGSYFLVQVRLVRTIGNNMYVEDAEEQSIEINDGEEIISGKGAFYAFTAYAVSYYRKYKIGEVFTMRCQLEWYSDYGTQLTGVTKASAAIKDMYALPEIKELDANDLGYSSKTILDKEGNEVQANVSDLSNYMCQVVKVKNLECVSVKIKDTDDSQYYVAVMENDKGIKFDVYFNKVLITPWKVTEILIPGKTYDIIGGIAYYEYANGYYQISVGDAPRYDYDLTTKEYVLKPEDITRINDIIEVE